MLSKHLVELFNRVHAQDEVQLICATHEDALMDRELLRRDEIWSVERKTSEGSRLYSLDAFGDVKTETSVEKRYWRGDTAAFPCSARWSLEERFEMGVVGGSMSGVDAFAVMARIRP